MSPNRQTDGQTDRQTDYSSPRCACAPRVNEVQNPRRDFQTYVSLVALRSSITRMRVFIKNGRTIPESL